MTQYTEDWFSHRIPEWKKHVAPALEHIKGVKWLELGSFEGRSAVWAIENALGHQNSRITCVDIWNSSYEKNFDANLETYLKSNKAEKIKGDCMDVLARLVLEKRKYHCVYVDADHQAKSALTEAALAWRMLQPGGILIFDDYPWKHKPEDRATKLPPKPGIDAFLECWQYELRVLHKGWQVIVQKI